MSPFDMGKVGAEDEFPSGSWTAAFKRGLWSQQPSESLSLFWMSVDTLHRDIPRVYASERQPQHHVYP